MKKEKESSKKLKILIVGPIKRRVASRVTAARPRLVFDIAKGLVKRGHQVSLLGTGDSKIRGVKIIPVIPRQFVDMPAFENEFTARTAFLTKQAKILENIGNDYDIIHNHTRPEFFCLFAGERLKTPILTTMHAVFDKETDETIALFKKHHIINISKAVARSAKKTKVYKVVYNGIDTSLYKFQAKKGDYLLWLGRLGRAKDKKGKFIDAKGIKWAIKLARATNSKLKLAGNVEDIEFYNKDVKPYLSKNIKWVGPVTSEQPLTKKQVAKLMGGAKAFLMTINWEEPFGLVMAEAMSTGTPVIGFDRGSVKELVFNGKTGFVVNPKHGLNGLKKALAKIDSIKPEDCRKYTENNFSQKTMIDNYEKTYLALCQKTKK